MKLIVLGKTYQPEYVERAVLFYEHLENHKEVREALIDRGIPICKICGKNANEIYDKGRD